MSSLYCVMNIACPQQEISRPQNETDWTAVLLACECVGMHVRAYVSVRIYMIGW